MKMLGDGAPRGVSECDSTLLPCFQVTWINGARKFLQGLEGAANPRLGSVIRSNGIGNNLEQRNNALRDSAS